MIPATVCRRGKELALRALAGPRMRCDFGFGIESCSWDGSLRVVHGALVHLEGLSRSSVPLITLIVAFIYSFSNPIEM